MMNLIKGIALSIALLAGFSTIVFAQKTMAAPYEVSKKERKEGFKALFDGITMDHWKGNNTDYVVEEGTITMRPSGNSGGNLYSKDTFENFILRFEFLLEPAGNNGLGIRHDFTEAGSGYKGMELQILDNNHPKYSKLEESQYHGSVYKIIPAKRGFLKPSGQWNYQEVRAQGDHIQVILNGEMILDGHLKEATAAMKEGTFMKEVLNKSGHLAFLGHGSVVKFKNLRIKRL